MLLNDYIADKPFNRVLALNKKIEQISQNNSILHDKVNLKYRNGIPWLKNQILAQIMSTSNKTCQSKSLIITYYDKTVTHEQADPDSPTMLHKETNTDGTTLPTE